MNGPAEAPDYETLKARWQCADLHLYTCSELERLLERRFNAYEIPLTAISAKDYANDEEVDERRVYRLMTITDPDVLARIHGETERQQQTSAAADVDEDWRGLFGHDDVSYGLLLIQHGQGTRTSVVLEADGGFVTGFKVYGTSYLLTDLLTALVGARGMRLGDIQDRPFQFYLECLASQQLI